MKESKLQYKNPKMEYILFEQNQDYDENKDLDMQMDSKIEINKSEECREATVALILEFGKDSSNSPFYLKIASSSDFRWEDIIEFDIDKTLKISGSTMLLSFLRPIIANITMQAGLPPFRLPFFDLTDES